MSEFSIKNIFGIFLLSIVVLFSLQSVSAQTIDYERSRHQAILSIIKSDIKKYYYDPKFRGIDLDARFKTAEERIKKANSIGEMSGIIAQVLVDFNDSHLFFAPPSKASKIEFGWQIQMIGDKCFVIWVAPKSDAEAKGLKLGDEVFSLEGFEPTRENLWKMNYFYRALRPRPTIKMEIIKPNGKQVALEINAKITERKRLKDYRGLDAGSDIFDDIRESQDEYSKTQTHYYYEGFENILIWKMPSFNLSPNGVDEMIGKVKKCQSLILDLRGNGGGRVDMLSRLISHLFTKDVKIGDFKERKKTTEEIAKTQGKDVFQGKIIVLVDSASGSASEVFARVMQIEKRGTVLGDRSAGAVMTSIQYPHEVGMDIVTFFGVSITIADLIMTDGKSLEHVGVMPDEKILPTAQDLANRRDPVLARALAMIDIKQTPKQAGALFSEEKNK
jgi:C-terminal processing protease CtpA/Prc